MRALNRAKRHSRSRVGIQLTLDMGERKGDCGRLAVEVNGTFLELNTSIVIVTITRDYRCAVGRRAARRAVRQHRAQQRSRPVLDGRSLRRGGGASAPWRGAQHPDRLEVSGDCLGLE